MFISSGAVFHLRKENLKEESNNIFKRIHIYFSNKLWNKSRSNDKDYWNFALYFLQKLKLFLNLTKMDFPKNASLQLLMHRSEDTLLLKIHLHKHHKQEIATMNV